VTVKFEKPAKEAAVVKVEFAYELTVDALRVNGRPLEYAISRDSAPPIICSQFEADAAPTATRSQTLHRTNIRA